MDKSVSNKVASPVIPSGLETQDTTLIDKATTLLPNAKLSSTIKTISTTTNSTQSSSTTTNNPTKNKTFSGDSSFGYRALRDFRKVLPSVLAELPKDISANDFRQALRNVVTQHRDALEKKLRNFNLDNEIIIHELEIFRIGGEETFEDEVLRRQKYEEEQARLLTELANKAKADIQRVQKEKENARLRLIQEQENLIKAAEREKAEELQAIGNALLDQMKELQQQELLRQEQELQNQKLKDEEEEKEKHTTQNLMDNEKNDDNVVSSTIDTSLVPSEKDTAVVSSIESVPVPSPVPIKEEKVLSPLQRIKLKTMADIKVPTTSTTSPNSSSLSSSITNNVVSSSPTTTASVSTKINPVSTSPTSVLIIDPTDPLAEWKLELLSKETPDAIKQILMKEVIVPLDNYLIKVRTDGVGNDTLLFIKRSDADNEAKQLLDNCVDKAKRILADIRCPATVEEGAISDKRAEMVKTVDKECNADTSSKIADWIKQETVNHIDKLIEERNQARAIFARDTFERVLPLAMPKNCRCGIIAAHTELLTGVVKSVATIAPARSGEKITDQSIQAQSAKESSKLKSLVKLTTSLKTMAKQAKKMVAVALNKEDLDAEERIIEKVDERNRTWADERAVSLMTARAGNVQNTGGFYTALATGKWDCARALLEGTKKDAGAARAAKSLMGNTTGVRLSYIAADDVLDAEETENDLKNSSSEYTEYLLSQHYEDIDVYPDGSLAYAGGRLYRSRVLGNRHGIGAIFEPNKSGIIIDPLRISAGASSIRLLLSPNHMSANDINMLNVNRALPSVVSEWDHDKLTGVARVFYSGTDEKHQGRLLATLYFKSNTDLNTVAQAAKVTNNEELVSSSIAMTVVSNVIGVTYIVDPLTIDYA